MILLCKNSVLHFNVLRFHLFPNKSITRSHFVYHYYYFLHFKKLKVGPLYTKYDQNIYLVNIHSSNS